MSHSTKAIGCRLHGEFYLIEDSRAGDLICTLCGLVVGDRMIDVGSEWRTFSDDTGGVDRCRVGAVQNSLFNCNDLSTQDNWKPGKAVLRENRLIHSKEPAKAVSAIDKAVKAGISSINEVAGRIFLSKKIVTSASHLFKQCYEKNGTRGRKHEAVVAACIYIACRTEGSPHTIKEICAISNVSKVEISRIVSWMNKNLTRSNRNSGVNPKELLGRFCNHLELIDSKFVRKTSIDIIEKAQQICDIQSRAPETIAGAAIYMACAAANENVTMKNIQEVTGASEAAIKVVYKIMLTKASTLFPPNFAFKRAPSNFPKT